MTQLTVTLKGDKQLMQALDGDLRKAMRRGAPIILREIRRELVEYPPASAANVPRGFVSKGNNRWYERGYGSRWARKDGSVGGSPTSEMLNRSWGIRKFKLGAIMASKASYSALVHHYKEQASFHKRRGWTTDKQAVGRVEKSGKMDRIMNAVIKRILKG